MRIRPPLAHHPRLAIMASLLIPLVAFGWAMPRITGEPRHWPFVIAMSFLLALVNYLARTRSARFLGYVMIAVSVAALMVYGRATAVQGIPQQRSELISWAMVIAIPLAGLVLGWWMLRRPRITK
jgi:hypothetical protein